jgi:hypothetical protein
MIRAFELSATPLAPADPATRRPVGPTDLRDPGSRALSQSGSAFSLAYRSAI